MTLVIVASILATVAAASIAIDLVRLQRVARKNSNNQERPSDSRQWRRSPLAAVLPPYRRCIECIWTSLQQLRQAEHDSRERYEVLSNNVAAGVVLHQVNGTVMWCSPYTEVLTGFSVSEILEESSSFFVTHTFEEDRDLLRHSLGIIASGEQFQCRYRFYHKSGRMLWLETRTVPIYDEGLDGYIALSITLDVTAAANNQMYVEERNRDLQDFTYMISHDLKAPIFTIKGMLGILEEDCAGILPDSAKDALEYIGRATGRLEQLVGGVLELARVSAADRTTDEVALDAVMFDVTQDYQRALNDIGGTLEVCKDLPTVVGNKTHAYQIFSNLINNAIKYRSQDAPLKISVTVHPCRSPRRVAIRVTDNGRGIPADKLPQLFKPFQRIGEESIEGTGVGLACVHRLVEKMSGTIEVSSDSGKGTTFLLELRRGKGTEISAKNTFDELPHSNT